MSGTISASCAICGQLALSPPEVILVAYGREVPKFCTFRRPRCGDAQRLEASRALVHKLRQIGAREVRIDPEAPTGPRLTLDDLIDLGLDLENL